MATSGTRLNWRIIAGIVFLLAAVVLAATVNPGPGPAILLALPGGALMAAGVRASRNAARPDGQTPPA
jgi:drug/metabolite transporter (DMT)-like permease